MLLWGVWYSTGTVEYVYGRRYLADGTVYVSKVTCGSAPEIVFFGRFDPDVPGVNTAADCTRAARTRLLEVAGLWALAGVATWLGLTHAKKPPVPIGQVLRPLPRPGREVWGRRQR